MVRGGCHWALCRNGGETILTALRKADLLDELLADMIDLPDVIERVAQIMVEVQHG